MSYRLHTIRDDADIMIVGCGGTGGFVAEGVARLIAGSARKLVLVDHDTVEEANLGRQNFTRADLGRFKAQALAERIAAEHDIAVNYETSTIEQIALHARGYLTIGCVDNPAARERLQWAGSGSFMQGRIGYQRSGGDGCWYIDAGNSEHSGQVLIGNCLLRECDRGFTPATGICTKLPLPQVQQPGLLIPDVRPQIDCAERVLRAEQSPVINQMMAALLVTFVHKLIAGTLGWMAAYIDLESGVMNAIDATPEAVARITGISVKRLCTMPDRKTARV